MGLDIQQRAISLGFGFQNGMQDGVLKHIRLVACVKAVLVGQQRLVYSSRSASDAWRIASNSLPGYQVGQASDWAIFNPTE